MGKQQYTDLSSLIADIKQDVGRIANKMARGVAEEAHNDLKIAHEGIMDSYYSGYDPVKTYYYTWKDPETGKVFSGYAHGYRRTMNLYNNSIVPKGVSPSGKHSFKATVEIGSENMNDYTTNVGEGHTFPASAVFDMVWNQANRGLPPEYRGHVGTFSINTSPVGVPISGSPNDAMTTFVNTWGNTRGVEIADRIAHSIS